MAIAVKDVEAIDKKASDYLCRIMSCLLDKMCDIHKLNFRFCHVHVIYCMYLHTLYLTWTLKVLYMYLSI